MLEIKARLKYLLKGNLYAFWNYHKLGYRQITYRGIPIILRDDMPENEVLMRQKDGTWIHANIKTRRFGVLKNVDNRSEKMKQLWKDARAAGFNNLAPYRNFRKSK